MRTKLWASWPFLLTCIGCGGLAPISSSFEAGAWSAPPGAGARLEVASDQVVATAAALDPSDLPDAARVTVESIQPGGEVVLCAREWRQGAEIYRIAVRYEGNDQRELLLQADGAVIERSHTIPSGDVPAPARTVARTHGTIRRASVVQGAPTEERYRFDVNRRDGARLLVECDARGDQERVARVLDGVVLVWR